MAKEKLDQKAQIRAAAEASLVTFINLVAPRRVLGSIHVELCLWWDREDALDNQLVLLPRDHQKSAMIAYRVAWYITKFPWLTFLYCSATADLAEKQLGFIKQILTCDAYQYYWPEMVHPQENLRERWTMDEISVDSPLRKIEAPRDPTVKAVGITANTTGLHCHIAVLDDVVVPGNVETELGKDAVRGFYSQLASIQTTDAQEWAVGTRYAGDDLYRDLMDLEEEYEDADGEWVSKKVYEVFQRQVETNGEFLWPVQRRVEDGKVFGFDAKILARKKAKYLRMSQFYAQYYNNPNVTDEAIIDHEKFNYYDRTQLRFTGGAWYLGDKALDVYAAIDFAYTVSDTADFTAIAVVGVDYDGFIYILDLIQFKTTKMSTMYEKTKDAWVKWRFKRLRAEATAAQRMIVEGFKENMRKETMHFGIETHYPTGEKTDRINAVLEPRYQNGTIYHYRGGNCQTLEEQLVLLKPEHDDLKDALHAAVQIAKVPMRQQRHQESNVVYHSRFGGVAFRGQ